MKTQEEYKKNPNKCIFCDSEDIVGGLIQADNNVAWQEVECESCGKTWQDVYGFSHFHVETEKYNEND